MGTVRGMVITSPGSTISAILLSMHAVLSFLTAAAIKKAFPDAKRYNLTVL